VKVLAIALSIIVAFLIGIAAYLALRPIAPPPSPPPFELKSWEIIDDWGYPAIYISYKATVDLHMKLIDPRGVVVDEAYPYKEGTGAILHMAGFWETPEPGTYTLYVYEARTDKLLLKREFTFTGARVEVISCYINKTWYPWGVGGISYVNITLKNLGDLPTYIDEVDVAIAGISDQYCYLWPPALMPNEQEAYCLEYRLTGIPEGTHTLTITIKDYEGEVLTTYTVEVTFP